MTQLIGIAVLLGILFISTSTGQKTQSQEINRRGR